MEKKLVYNKIRLFFTAFLQVYFVCLNIIFITSKIIIYIFISSFCINILWTFNIKKVAFGDNIDRLVYAIGAAIGSISGVISFNFIKKFIL